VSDETSGKGSWNIREGQVARSNRPRPFPSRASRTQTKFGAGVSINRSKVKRSDRSPAERFKSVIRAPGPVHDHMYQHGPTLPQPESRPGNASVVLALLYDALWLASGISRRCWRANPGNAIANAIRYGRRRFAADHGRRHSRTRSIRWRARRHTDLSAVAVEVMLVSSIVVVVSPVVARATAVVTRGEKRSRDDDRPDSRGACLRTSLWRAVGPSLRRSRRFHLFYVFTNGPRTRVLRSHKGPSFM
jgi:hypothetical protein